MEVKYRQKYWENSLIHPGIKIDLQILVRYFSKLYLCKEWIDKQKICTPSITIEIDSL